MDLPVRIVGELPSEPVILVDGFAPGGRGLCLSHWPGNATPADLVHELSTGAALRFARLADEERKTRSQGAVAIVNNHYDTDGTCALFATRFPRVALEHAAALENAAAAGDFFRIPDWDALRLDFLIGGLADPERSPLDLVGLTDLERWNVANEHLMEHLPAILAGDVEAYRDTFEVNLEAVRADLSDLDRLERSEHPRAAMTLWQANDRGVPRRSSRAGAPDHVNIGRHALFGSTEADRAFVLTTDERGTFAHLVVSTRSWFELPESPGARQPARPDFEGIARELNALEGIHPEQEHAWRALAADHASPELWFGTADCISFAEHPSTLRPSTLRADRILSVVLAGLTTDSS